MNFAQEPEDNVDEDELDEEINELRMKKELSEKAFTCLYDEIESEKTDNEKTILGLRKEIASLREEYAECIRGDQRVIIEVFRKRGRRELLAMQNSDIGPATLELDNKLSKLYRELDIIKHARRKKADEFVRLNDEVVDLENFGDTAYEKHLHQITNTLYNDIEKAKMNTDTGYKIFCCYKKIRDSLAADVNKYPNKIKILEKKLARETTEHREITSVYRHAVKHHKRTVGLLTELEQSSLNERRHRDLTLIKTRKLVEERFQAESWKKPASSNHLQKIGSSPFGLQHAFTMANEADIRAKTQPPRQLKMLDLIEAFDKIKDTLMVTDVADVVQRFQEQAITHHRLVTQREERSQRLKGLKAQIKHAVDRFNTLKYSQKASTKSMKNDIDKMADRVIEKENKLAEARAKYHEVCKLMGQVRLATVTLFDKISVIKLKPPHRNYSVADPLEDLRNCQNKLEFIYNEIAAITDPRVLFRCLGPDHRQQFMQFADSRLPPENNRFLADSEDLDADSYLKELEDRPDYLSNKDVKQKSKKFIDAKTLKRKL